jgi:hypothetical protein
LYREEYRASSEKGSPSTNYMAITSAISSKPQNAYHKRQNPSKVLTLRHTIEHAYRHAHDWGRHQH